MALSSAPHPALDVAGEDAESLLSTLALDTVSLRDVYTAACTRWRRAPNRHVLEALPGALGAYEVIDTLDFSACYVGRQGWAPLLPLVVCCERLRVLSVAGVGLRPREVDALLDVVAAHPSLTELDLSRNEVGTVCAQKLLKVAKRNQRLTVVRVEDSLVIPALAFKLTRQLDVNAAVQEELPLRALRFITARGDGAGPSPEEAAEELRRREEREKARLAILETLPYWVPAALQELTELFDAHQAHLGDLSTMFNERHATADEFARVMKAVGVRFPVGGTPTEGRELTLGKLLGCLVHPRDDTRAEGGGADADADADADAATGVMVPADHGLRGEQVLADVPDSRHRIDHGRMIALLRVPTVVVEAKGGGEEGGGEGGRGDPGADWWDKTSPAGYHPGVQEQAVMDYLYDHRDGLTETLQMIEAASAIGVVTLDEFLAGFAALDITSSAGALGSDEKAAALRAVLRAVGAVSAADLEKQAAATEDEPMAVLLDYRSVFARLRPGQSRSSGMRWDKLTTSGLRAFIHPAAAPRAAES